MEKDEIKKMIRDEIQLSLQNSMFSVAKVPFHTHNNLDAPQIRFTSLSQVPSSFDGESGQALLVNSLETGLEFGSVVTAPAGSNTQIQYNNSGAFGASSTFTFNSTDKYVLIDALKLLGDASTTSIIESTGNDLYLVTNDVTDGGNVNSILIQPGAVSNGGNAGNVSIYAGSKDNSGAVGNVTLVGSKNGSTFLGNVIINDAAIATGSNGGFLVIPTCAGTPTGTPASNGSMVYDTSNNKLYVYNSAWKSVTLA